MTQEHLLAQAEAAERLAQVVSYGPDKQRLGEQAARLRERAANSEQQSWKPVQAEQRR